MVTMDLIKAGQKISIYFEKSNNKVEMICMINEAYNDRLVLEPPQYFMRYVECLQVGRPLMAKIFSKLGTIDFNTVIISSPLEDEFAVELDYNSIKLTENAELPVVNAMVNLDIVRGDALYKVRTFELSTEFFRFYSDVEFEVGEALDFTLYLPKDYGIISFKGIISEIDPIYDNEYTANYLTISESNRQDLLYYMYIYSMDIE